MSTVSFWLSYFSPSIILLLSSLTICLNYAEGLSAFCGWCVTRGYMESNPLKDLADFDLTPKSVRRSLTAEEVRRLLNACPIPQRRLLYEVALASGLRAGELAKLTANHLDIGHNSIRLDAGWTKNRKGGFQPIPASKPYG